MKRFLSSTPLCKYLLPCFCAMTLGVSTPSWSQAPIQPDTGSPLQRGLGEALRSGTQGGTIGDSLRRGVGETAQSAIETPDQRLQRDQQRRVQDQLQAQQRAPFGQPDLRYSASGDGSVRLLQDGQGRSYYLDNQGQRVYTQGQAQGQIQGRTLGVSIDDTSNGVRVLNVRRGSAAEQAGLRQGDIIQSINGQPMNSSQELVRIVNESQTDQLSMQVIREGQSQQMTAMLTDAEPDYRVAKPAIDSGASNSSGLSEQLSELQSQLARMQKELGALRQEVDALRTSNGNTELLNNTEATPLGEDSPTRPNATSPAGGADDLFGDADDLTAPAE